MSPVTGEGAQPIPAGRGVLRLHGRDAELTLLAASAQDALDGHGSTVVVCGPPGIGKTSLLDQACRDARRAGVVVVRGSADRLRRMTPLAALLDTLRSGPVPVIDRDEADRLSHDAPTLYWAVQRIARSVESFCSARPLVVALDDAHWADPATLLALRAMTAGTAAPVTWWLARRAQPEPPELVRYLDAVREDGGRELRLPPLGPADVRALLRDVAGSEPDEQVVAASGRAGGNPFYLSLLAGTPPSAAAPGRPDPTPPSLSPPSLSPDVVAAVTARLQDLSEQARRLLGVGSVLGHSFAVSRAASVLGQSSTDLLPAVVELTRQGLLAEHGGRLRFAHDVVQESTYASLPRSVRRAMHLDVAHRLTESGHDALEVAPHLVRGAEPGDAAAINQLEAAARAVHPRSASTAADLTLAATALRPPDDPRRVDGLARALVHLARSGRAAEAESAAEAELGRAHEPGVEARLRCALAVGLLLTGHWRSAAQHCAKALRQPGLAAQLTRSLLAQDVFLNSLVDPGRFERSSSSVAALADGPRDPMDRALLRIAAGLSARRQGRLRDSVRINEEVVRETLDAGPAERHVHPHLYLALSLLVADELEQGGRAAARGAAIARDMGSPWALALYDALEANRHLGSGRLADADGAARSALGHAEQFDLVAAGQEAQTVLGEVAIHRLDLPALRRHAAEVRRSLHRDEVVATGGSPRPFLVEHALLDGDPASAAQLYEAAAEDVIAVPWIDPQHARTVRMGLALGRRDTALAVAAAADRLARANADSLLLQGVAAHAHGLCQHDRRALEAAVEHLDDGSRPLHLASALESCAARAAVDGDREQAVAQLTRCLRILAGCGATGDAGRVRRQLARLGARAPARSALTRPHSGWGSLTPTEARVAALVATGRTNGEVAEEMTLSRNTIKTHLSHVFDKLRVRSRRELRRVVEHEQACAR